MSGNSGWRVYLVSCQDGTLYCGSTTDIDRRIGEHNCGKGAKYTKSRGPVKLVWSTPAESRSAAFKREAAIKKMSRSQKILLIES
jgi:putative endonuclease